MDLPPDQLAAIDDQLFAGNLITAIRDYRGVTGADLPTANLFINTRLQHLRATRPAQFPVPVDPFIPNPAIMELITPISNRELSEIRRTIKRIEKLLFGRNYEIKLSASAALAPRPLPINELMLILYPESEPNIATLRTSSVDDAVTDIAECLKYQGDASAGPQFTPRRASKLENQLLPQYWEQLNNVAPFETSTSYSYESDIGLPGDGVFWSFAYLIECSVSDRCLVVTGASSD